MKKITILIVAFLIANIAFAQQGINYKAIIIDNGSIVLKSRNTFWESISFKHENGWRGSIR